MGFVPALFVPHCHAQSMARQFAHRARRVHERQDGTVVAAQEGFALHVHRPHNACARGAAREQAPIRAHVALLVGGLAANFVNRLHDGGELCPRGAGERVRWGRWGRGARRRDRLSHRLVLEEGWDRCVESIRADGEYSPCSSGAESASCNKGH